MDMLPEEIHTNNGYAYTSLYNDFYSGTNSSTNYSQMIIYVYPTFIKFVFSHGGHGFGAIKSTNPKFAFTIGYTD